MENKEKNLNKKNKEETKTKKPVKYNFRYYYSLFRLSIGLFKAKYKPIVDRRAMDEIDSPCLIFCNHGSVFDFILAGLVIMPQKAVI